jgi:Derlin-2/3
MFLAPSLAFMVVYVWGRRNPHVTLSFLGLFNFTAPYLPWVILGFGMVLGQNPVFDLLGIVVGHIYYYLEDIYPQLTGGRKILITPGILYVTMLSNVLT